MANSFKQNVGCMLTGKENFEQWFDGITAAAQYENLWLGHLDKSPILPIDRDELMQWKIDDMKIRAALLITTQYSLHNLVNQTDHETAWKVLQVFKQNFDTKSDLEFVHLIMKMNKMKMQKGKSSTTINLLHPIKQSIDRDFRHQCITSVFLIQSCLHIPDYKNLLATLSASGALQYLNFEELAAKFIALDKTFDTDHLPEESRDVAFEVETEANFSRGQRGRGRGRNTGRGRGRGRQSYQGPRQFQGPSEQNTGFRNPNQGFNREPVSQQPGSSSSFRQQRNPNQKIVCNRCNKPGHISSVCRTPFHLIQKHKAHNVTEGKDDYTYFESNNAVFAQVEDKETACSSSGTHVEARSGYVDVELEEISSLNFKAGCTFASNSDWIMDTGATQHMTGNRGYFQELNTSVHGTVHMADKTSQPIQGIGTVKLYLKDLPAFKLKDVLYVPALKQNLLSLSTIIDKG